MKFIQKLLLLLLSSSLIVPVFAKSKAKEYFEIRVYHFTTTQQETSIDNYLQQSLFPSLHNKGISRIGAFKALSNDTAADKKVYVLVPYKSYKDFLKLRPEMQGEALMGNGGDYMNAAYDKPAFTRYETIVISAFPEMTKLEVPKLREPRSERVYELRSYEGPTDKLYKNKIQMFNKGGEVTLFKRLGFNAVFYGEVIAGSRMPNLMYMTSFDNMQSRQDHWKTFSSDPEWKTLSSKPEYQHNVSKADIIFLRATEYSNL